MQGVTGMSVVDDLVKGVVDGVLGDILKKATGTGKRARRRRTASAGRRRTTTSSRTLQRIERLEKLLRPARKQVSRRKTTQTRSKTQRRRVATKIRRHRRSLRRGAATR